jgi:AraC family transcriptional activator of tynA and feaB
VTPIGPPGSKTSSGERSWVWSTSDAAPRERFAYYREAICKAFMNLTPEPPASADFEARIESIGLGAGAINRVRFPSHTINRLTTDIAASDATCFYLNLKLRGHCQIDRAGRGFSLSPGQVGIFESERPFAIAHAGAGPLEVASFWVPSGALQSRLSGFAFAPARLSDHPTVGHLIVETARTLNEAVLTMAESDGVRLFDVLLDLVAFALSHPAGTPPAAAFASATTLRLRREVHRRLRQPGLSVSSIAAVLGISDRYVHKLFERTGRTFEQYVIEHRLDGAAVDLRDPGKQGRPIGAIAFDWAFADLSHFSRRFKARFGCTPTAWRAGR